MFSQHVCSFEVTILHIGDWSNGMIGVSKTFGGSSILSSPAFSKPEMLGNKAFSVFVVIKKRLHKPLFQNSLFNRRH